MATTTLGKVAVTPKGAWSNSTAYEVLDIVTNSGSAYMAKQAVPAGTALSNTSYWILLVEKGDKGDTGEITGASASISGGYGTPGVSVTAGGTSTERSFSFEFSNLVGNGIASITMEKTSTSGNVDTYTLTVTTDDGNSEALEIEVTNGAVTSVNGRTGAVTGLAEADGTYPELTSGQMLSDNYTEDQVPYNFRRSGGGVEVGTVEKDTVIGGTIAWNQLATNGDFSNGSTDFKPLSSVQTSSISVSNGIATITQAVASLTGVASMGITREDAAKFLFIKDHIYILSATIRASKAFNIYCSARGKTYTGAAANTWKTFNVLWKKTSDTATTAVYWSIYNYADFEQGDTYDLKNYMITDLTQAFGSTIAEYIYNLEMAGTTDNGSGIAWLKANGFFLKDYYAYGAGSLQSVNTSAHVTTGFNQWDEEWESGAISSTTGQNSTNAERCRSKNYIPVLPTVEYHWHNDHPISFRLFYYDAAKNFVEAPTTITVSTADYDFVVPSGVYYIRFILVQSSITAPTGICINLSDPALNGTYEPYVKHSYALDSDLTLRGILKLDASNRLYYDGDTYEADGTVTRIVYEDTLTVNKMYSRQDNENYDWAVCTLSYPYAMGSNKTNINKNVVGEKVLSNNNSYTFSSLSIEIGTVLGYSQSDKQIAITVAKGTTKAQAEATYNGTKICYKMQTDFTESADPYALYQAVDEYGTEAYVDYAESQGTRDVAIPVGHQTLYYENARKKLSQLPKNFSTLIAPTESTYTATRNYTTNALFIVNNILYKATANIANGGTITPNTNCTATTLAEIIAEL